MRKLFVIIQFVIVLCVLSSCNYRYYQGYVYDMFEKTPIAGLEVYSCLGFRLYRTPMHCADGNTVDEGMGDENDYFRFRDSCIHCTVSDMTGGGVTDENGYFRFGESKKRAWLAYFRIESEGKYIGTIPRIARVSRGYFPMFVDGRADTVFIDMTGKTPHNVGFYFGKKVRKR